MTERSASVHIEYSMEEDDKVISFVVKTKDADTGIETAKEVSVLLRKTLGIGLNDTNATYSLIGMLGAIAELFNERLTAELKKGD